MDNLTLAINEYAMDTENPENNFQLALIYDEIGQTASAITYYMRAAELTEDKLLAYESLLKQAQCFIRQGNRSHTVSVLYKHAICLFPKRPEAHYLLSSLYANDYSFVDSYVGVNNALYFLDEGRPPLRTNVGYPGKWGLLLVKSIVAWLWGKGNEARETLLELWNSHKHEMDESSINILKERFKISNVEIPKEENHETQEQIRMNLQQKYYNACATQSDINEHLPFLLELAKTCDTITEFGIREGNSTLAFILSEKKLKAYDIDSNPEIIQIFSQAKRANYNVELYQADVLNLEIEETDLLFIDTWHCYDQLKLELEMHANKAKKYIVFHDTVSYGIVGQPKYQGIPLSPKIEDKQYYKGLMPAIYEFLAKNPNWNIKEHRTNNNGLTVVERIN